MELRKENVHVLRVKSKAESQITFDEDYNVPDTKPDIGRMIQSKGQVQMDEVNLSDNKAFLKGTFSVDLLYVGDGEGKVYSFTANLPIVETLNLDGIESGDKMCLKWEIEDLSLHVINSRKLNIKAILTFSGVVDDLSTISLPVEAQEEGISVKKKKIRVLGLCVHKKDTMRVKEEIVLASNKPNISEILWSSLEVRGLDIRPAENQVQVRGELFAFVLYAGDEEGNPLQWLEYALPFKGEVECSGCSGEMLPNIEVNVLKKSLEVKPDSDGEERLIQVDAVLELDMKLYQEEEHEILLDVYTPLKECIPKGKTEVLESLLIRNYSKCRVNDRVEVKETQGKILQICHSHGKIKIDKTRPVEKGIQVDGVIHLKILYIVGNDEMPFYSMEAMVPFTHIVEAEGITDKCVYYLRPDLEQLSATMVDSDQIEVKAVISLNTLVLRREEETIISEIQEEPLDMEKIQAMPGITVYIVQPRDTLWDIAKRFYTTVDQIQKLNGLEGEPKPRQPLLLVKKVES